ncbi:MAG: AAA family ATPase [Deltaproteobacteria bacterium]|nr:AAA family ATPase [Deltaproteobacteria bacterium]
MKNIVLTGFMGTGKSSVGRRLAKELGLRFVDMDAVIEKDAGVKIKNIFASRGEAHFRRLEKVTVGKLVSGAFGDGLVVAAGGGVVVDDENRAALRKWATLICLTAPVDVLLRRVAGGDDRPLLSVEDKKTEIEKRLKDREAAYRDCDLTVDTSSIGIDDVVKEIERFLKT